MIFDRLSKLRDTDAYLDELTRQVMNVTGLGRLANTEARLVVDTVLRLHGQPLNVPRLAPHAIARTLDGQPIYADGADHSPTETVTLQAGR